MTRIAAPQLAGYRYVEKIGTGGFADVFRYEQEFPTRNVAVKVLRESTDAGGKRQFQDEANVMAQLSGHPAIVPIYQADVSEDGRAYLVMEYCPPPHLAQRYRKERIQVGHVLDIGVRVASAVETAHRAGIMHRDIKPHNILTSAYGAPLLTDFGIAAAAGEDLGQSQGLSIPWSPAESFQEDVPLDVRSDVYSLAATIYSLLAGRTPFEVPGAPNDTSTLIHRIENQEPSRIIRADVPDSLNALLARALSRRIDKRPPSAMALAQELQEIQIELELPPTRLEVMDASPGAAAAGQVEDDRTEIRPISIIVPDRVAQQGTMLRSQLATRIDDRTDVRRPTAVPLDTVHKRPAKPVGDAHQSPFEPPTDPETEDGPRSRAPFLVGGVLLALVATVVGAVLVAGPNDEPETAAPRTPAPDLGNVISAAPPTPTDLMVTRDGGQVLLTWQSSDPEDGDTYRIRSGASLQDLQRFDEVTEPRLVRSLPAGGVVCASIIATRDGRGSAEALEDCVAP